MQLGPGVWDTQTPHCCDWSTFSLFEQSLIYTKNLANYSEFNLIALMLLFFQTLTGLLHDSYNAKRSQHFC